MMRPLFFLLLALLAIPAVTKTDRDAGDHDSGARAIRGAGLAAKGAAPGSPDDARPLPFIYDLYSFRGDTGTTDVVASFAVRAGDLDRERVDGETRYRFNVTLVLADTVHYGVSHAHDSVYVGVPRPLNRDHLLYTHVETRVRPSTTTVHRVIMFDAPSPGIGQLYTRPFAVPDYSGSELMLSDIALGQSDSEGGWRRGGETVALLPSSHIPGGAFDVFYEIYNLPDGHQYDTDIAVEPVPGSGDPAADPAADPVDDPADDPEPDEDRAIHVRFSGEAELGPDGVLSELRRVDAPLAAGRHRLTVTVTDRVTGRTARRARHLEIRSWREGGTLVLSCPVAPGAVRPGCS